MTGVPVTDKAIEISFSSGLEWFLRRKGRKAVVIYNLRHKSSIKDIIESLGVPHTEIGDISSNRRPLDFNHIPAPGDSIAVAEVFPPFDIRKPSFLRPEPFDTVRFAVDVNAGKAAVFLRALGFDAEYSNSWTDAEIASVARTEKRVVISKDIELLKRKQIVYGRFLRAAGPYEQIAEIVHFFGLKGPFNFFSRCLICNVPLRKVEKSQICHRLKPRTKKYYNNFMMCGNCGRIYWNGSHGMKMRENLALAGVDLAGESSSFGEQ